MSDTILEHDILVSKILYYSDVDDLLIFGKINLLNFSEINVKFNKVLSERYFWSLYFDKYDLPMTKENYTNFNDWINIFKKINNANIGTLSSINLLTANKKLIIDNINGIDFNIDEYLTNISMTIILDQINHLKIKYPNVDLICRIEIKNKNGIYIIKFKIIYGLNTDIYGLNSDITGMTLKKCDLYKIIYPLIFSTCFKIILH